MASKKTKPRYGWSGVVKVPDAALETRQLEKIGQTLGIKQGDRKKLKMLRDQIEPLIATCRTWVLQDEGGPSVAERRAMLNEVLQHAGALRNTLARLDSVTAGDLAVSYSPGGFEKFQHDKGSPARLEENAVLALERLSHSTGPRPRTTLRWLVKQLEPIWETHTGLPCTHSPYLTEQGERRYQGRDVSKPGCFILSVALIAYPNEKQPELARSINSVRSNRKTQKKARVKKIPPPKRV